MSTDLNATYHQRLPVYEQLRSEAVFALEHALSGTDRKIHSITSRIKTLESVTKKVERKGIKDPFSELSDIVGLRVVCLFLADISEIVRITRSVFDVAYEDDKMADNASVFGYLSHHLIVFMKSSHSGPRYDKIAGIRFELQVRTIAMDAWANVSHHLSYKAPADIPADLQRDFYALSGLFYVADKHFEMFYSASAASRRQALEAFAAASPDVLSEPLNADTLSAYLRTRFPDRHHGKPDAISDLLAEIVRGGMKTTDELDRIIALAEDAVSAYEAERLSPTQRLADTGAVRIAVRVSDPAFHAASLREVTPVPTEEQIAQQYAAEYARYRSLLKQLPDERP